MISYLIYFNAGIGFLVEAVLLFYFLKEVWRAWRQAGRVATIHARYYHQRRKPTVKEFLYVLNYEFCRTYSALQIGRLIVPYEPSHKISRTQYPY